MAGGDDIMMDEAHQPTGNDNASQQPKHEVSSTCNNEPERPKHIRPRVRNRRIPTTTAPPPTTTTTLTTTTTGSRSTANDDPTTQLQHCTYKKKNNNHPKSAPSWQPPIEERNNNDLPNHKKNKSILKKNPKYTQNLVDQVVSLRSEVDRTNNEIGTGTGTTIDISALPNNLLINANHSASAVVEAEETGFVITERTHGKNRHNRRKEPVVPPTSSHAIEGYEPKLGHRPPASKPVPNQSPKENAVVEEQSQHASPPVTSNPKTNAKSNEDNHNNAALVFDSLADLMETAGTLPDENDNSRFDEAGTVIEADLSFNVMSPEDFEATIHEQEEGCHNNVAGIEDDPAMDGPLEEEEEEEEERSDDEEREKENLEEEGGGGGSFWDLMDDNDGDDAEPVFHRQERAFLVLWKAISQWVTPSAVEYVNRQQQREQNSSHSLHESFHDLGMQPQTSTNNNNNNYYNNDDWSDVEASRCAGLMSLLQLYIGPCLQNDLQTSLEERRNVEQRLGQLIRLFDYRRPSPKLNVRCTRALTCILIQTVRPDLVVGVVVGVEQPQPEQQQQQHSGNGQPPRPSPVVPPSCQAIGLTMEEYHYLVKSAISNFKSPH